MNQKNDMMRSIRNGLEARRKQLAKLETMTLNNEINDKINHLKKEIRILESELNALL